MPTSAMTAPRLFAIVALQALLLLASSIQTALAEHPTPDLSAKVQSVANAPDVADQLSFQLDVQPVLTKTGCNTGACHGKQRGQNGFQLSLLGFDSDFDHDSITRGGRGRRVFPASPDQSLLLLKATAAAPHGGGKRLSLESDEYEILRRWIANGASRTRPNEPQLERVELESSSFVLEPSQKTQLRTVAHYDDGTSRIVTELTDYQSNEPSIAAVNLTGQIEAGRLPGETAVMARYMNHVCVADVVIPNDALLSEADFQDLPSNNFIDQLVYEKLATARVLPSEEVGDSLFLRRVHLDLIGRLPSAQEVRSFLASNDERKRELLVDKLLDRPEFVDHWANKWADLLRPNPYRVGIKAVLNYDNWIRQQFRDSVRYDEFVKSLITAKGSTWRNGAVTLFRDRRSPDEMATLVSQLFLGVRLECAKCHHHPFEKWSQDDFYQFAAYFARVGHKGTGLSPPISGGEETVFVSTSGSVKHPTTGAVMSPKPLFGAAAVDDGQDPRAILADWIASPGNEFFARVQANRIWSILMGRGLVEPVDDLRSTNPATNPEVTRRAGRTLLCTRFRSEGTNQDDRAVAGLQFELHSECD